jgi:hypothetical protein
MVRSCGQASLGAVGALAEAVFASAVACDTARGRSSQRCDARARVCSAIHARQQRGRDSLVSRRVWSSVGRSCPASLSGAANPRAQAVSAIAAPRVGPSVRGCAVNSPGSGSSHDLDQLIADAEAASRVHEPTALDEKEG